MTVLYRLPHLFPSLSTTPKSPPFALSEAPTPVLPSLDFPRPSMVSPKIFGKIYPAYKIIAGKTTRSTWSIVALPNPVSITLSPIIWPAFSKDAVIKVATRQRYADKAIPFLESECELPKLSAMTALSMLANYYSLGPSPLLVIYTLVCLARRDQTDQISDPATFPFLQGISARMTVGLGIDCSPWVETCLITEAGMLDCNLGFVDDVLPSASNDPSCIPNCDLKISQTP
jgi:hypothetical protein